MPKKPVHRFGLPESSRRGDNVENAAFVNAVGFLSSAEPLQHFCWHGYSAFWVIHTRTLYAAACEGGNDALAYKAPVSRV